jgi:hypothetical protein
MNNKMVQVALFVFVIAAIIAGLKMMAKKTIPPSSGAAAVVNQPANYTIQQPVSAVTVQPPAQIDPAWLAYTQTAVPEGGPMTGEQCAAAGAAAGWSATWGPASDGCWIISPDGRQIRHLGTWAGQ